LLTETLTRPSRAPRFYVWLCREMPKRPELQGRADWRFLRRLLEACSDPAFKGQHSTLRELFDGGGLVDRIVEALEPEQAAQLRLLLQRDVGLEEHRRKELQDFLELRFPELREKEDKAIYVSAAALERKREELEQLVRVDIPRNTEEIRRAAAHGDLRENFEYHAARQRQEMLSSRAKTLHDELQRARALDPQSVDTSVVRVGTRVLLQALHDGEQPLHLTILGPWDSDPAQGVVSYLAPAVGALLGKSVGEAVRFGEQEFRIARIDAWSP
jgi:transcription elongation GreA/GreB family factor